MHWIGARICGKCTSCLLLCLVSAVGWNSGAIRKPETFPTFSRNCPHPSQLQALAKHVCFWSLFQADFGFPPPRVPSLPLEFFFLKDHSLHSLKMLTDASGRNIEGPLVPRLIIHGHSLTSGIRKAQCEVLVAFVRQMDGQRLLGRTPRYPEMKKQKLHHKRRLSCPYSTPDYDSFSHLLSTHVLQGQTRLAVSSYPGSG